MVIKENTNGDNMNKNTEMNPRDRLNDEGQNNFPKTLAAKLKKRDEYRRF